MIEKCLGIQGKIIVTCEKHGLVPTYGININRGTAKNYYVCWHCIGEFGSQYCTVKGEE